MIDISNLISFLKDECDFTSITDEKTSKFFSDSRKKTGAGFVFEFLNSNSYFFSYKDLYFLTRKKILNQLTLSQFLLLLETITLLDEEWDFEDFILDEIDKLLLEIQDL